MTTTITGATGIDNIQAATGAVLQVVEGATTTQTAHNSTSFAATAITASITPSSTSSKILVSVTSNIESNGAGEKAIYSIYRSTTPIAFGHTLQPTGASGSIIFPIALQKLDSPSTASAVTYTLYIKRTDATIVGNLNSTGDGRTQTGTITLMEIAG